MTGLTVTIGAVVTLFVLMQTTGRVDWSEVFPERPPSATPPPLIPSKPISRKNDEDNDGDDGWETVEIPN